MRGGRGGRASMENLRTTYWHRHIPTASQVHGCRDHSEEGQNLDSEAIELSADAISRDFGNCECLLCCRECAILSQSGIPKSLGTCTLPETWGPSLIGGLVSVSLLRIAWHLPQARVDRHTFDSTCGIWSIYFILFSRAFQVNPGLLLKPIINPRTPAVCGHSRNRGERPITSERDMRPTKLTWSFWSWPFRSDNCVPSTGEEITVDSDEIGIDAKQCGGVEWSAV